MEISRTLFCWHFNKYLNRDLIIINGNDLEFTLLKSRYDFKEEL